MFVVLLQVEVVPVLVSDDKEMLLAPVRARCPPGTQGAGFIEVSPGTANPSKPNSSSSSSGGTKAPVQLKCKYYISVPLLKGGDKVSGLTIQLHLVSGTKVTTTKSMAGLTKTKGFRVKDSSSSSRALGECAVVSEAFAGLLPLKLEAGVGSSKGREGTNLPAQQQVTVYGDANLTSVATLGPRNTARPLACGDYQVGNAIEEHRSSNPRRGPHLAMMSIQTWVWALGLVWAYSSQTLICCWYADASILLIRHPLKGLCSVQTAVLTNGIHTNKGRCH